MDFLVSSDYETEIMAHISLAISLFYSVNLPIVVWRFDSLGSGKTAGDWNHKSTF